MFETANTNHNSTEKEHSQNFSAIVSIVIKLGTQSLDFQSIFRQGGFPNFGYLIKSPMYTQNLSNARNQSH